MKSVRRYRKANPEKVRATQKISELKNPDSSRLRKHRRRTRLRNNGGSYTIKEIQKLRIDSFGFCRGWRREKHLVGIEKLEIDHIIPLAKGGRNDIGNIQLLCRFCNRSKGIRLVD